MPTALRQHQYEISAMDGSSPLLFGTEETGYLTIDRPTHAGGDPRDADTDRDGEDGVAFGRDHRAAKTVSFSIGVLTDKASVNASNPHLMNLDYLDRLESLWQSRRFRDEPGRMAMLRACEVTGRTYRAYGRPRRYEEAAGRLTRSGYTPVVCDFKLTDNAWYADVESIVTATLRPSPQGGFKAPLVAPITSILERSISTATATITGNRPTWPVIEFHGPSIDPSVQIGDFEAGIRGALAHDEVIVFDPSPWVRSVTRQSDGADMSGRLSAATVVMRRAQIDPGTHTVEYRGLDVTGESYARVRWRNARSRP
jgi:hypothetical protein